MLIRAMDPGNDGLPKVLVITRSLEGDRKEVSRDLTGSDGFLQPIELAPGLYETIATYPYGDLKTQVKDFVVIPGPSMTIEIHLNFDSDQRVSLNVIESHVQVFDQEGRPAVRAWVIGRNMEATTGTSVAKTDERGFASVSVPVDGASIIVLYHGESWSEPAYTETGVADCQNLCLVRAKQELKGRSRILQIRLPQQSGRP